MRTSHWIVIAAVVVGAGAGFLGARKLRHDRLNPPTATPVRQVTAPTEAQELEAIKDALIIDYQPPPSPPQSARPRDRWLAPPLYVFGRVARHRLQVTGAVSDPALAEPEDPEASSAKGPRPEDAIRLAMRHKRAIFEHCFDVELRKQAVFSGFVVLSVSVSTRGEVTHARVIEGDRREKAVGACIAWQLRRMKLPALAYDAELIVPIRLEAKQPVS